MAGFKYERFIVKMSLEQKLRLITSTEFYKSNPVGGYEFPVFDIKNQPYGEGCKGVRVTQFPSDAALISSWNTPLVEEVYSAIAAEARFKNSFAYFACTNDLSGENLTSEHFVLGKFLAEKVAGLRRGGGFVNFESVPVESEDDELLKRNVRDTVLSAVQPTSTIFTDVEEAEFCAKRFKCGSLVYGVVSTVEEALDFLYSGASFLFLKEDVFDGLLNRLTELTTAFKAARGQFLNGQMTESNYARLLRNFRIFDGEIIDKACNDIIDIIYTMKDDGENGVAEFKGLDGSPALFDEGGHDRLAITAARQSAVLIKNEGGILPLKHGAKLAVMGEYANKLVYQREYYNSTATVGRLPFEVINDYGLDTVGFAAGYAKGETGRGDLADHVDALCAKADCALVYLAAGKGQKKLPPEQLELLNRLNAKGIKIIAVVASDGNIDTGFTDLCAAVLLTYASGQGGAVAALDIITGETCPSGKLVSPAGRIEPDGSLSVQYPVGHGLSYTQFEYDNLKVNESGVSFTVRNVGACDGYAVPQLYVKKKNTTTVFKNKLLKGFTKVFVKAGDAVRVKIVFDELTFSLYNDDGGYSVEGGLYTVTVGERFDDERLSGILLLKDYSEKHTFDNTVE
ncbi:MAG: glycoside hydrolase family 3 C-terminal domain-containing protein, partial [Clostridia bacterium]|nr:glycoside hydrolase family 3 C-terminal domain-containing protein [Clostridia bacterium]